jgi:gamma-glutamyltranspeptidase / glutathione hydrolase
MHSLTVLLIVSLLLLPAYAVQPPAAAIASAPPLATDVGIEILNAGGIAFNAAVAASDSRGPGKACVQTTL